MEEIKTGTETLETPEEGNLEELATTETVEDEKSKEILEKNKKLYERTKKAEEDRKKLRDEIAAKQAEIEKLKAGGTDKPDEIDSVLKLQSEGYSQAEILKLRQYAKKMNLHIAEVANDELIKAGISEQRRKARVEDGIPAPSSTGVVTVKGKSWAEMTPAERKANYNEVVDKIAEEKAKK